jgi:hypothetical protein
MGGEEIDRLPISQLVERYKIVRSAVYTRLNALNIEPIKVGNKAYVNAEQLRQLDALHEFIQRGGTIPEFQESHGIPRQQAASSSGLASSASSGQSEIAQFAAGIAAQFAARLQPPVDPLSYFEKLEQAARNGWLLRTSEVADLLDLLPSEIQLYGDRFFEAGFIFTKAGYRAGGEVAWRVSKPIK